MYQQLINLELKTDVNGAIRGYGKASIDNLQNKVQIPLLEDSFPGFMCNLCRNILSINIFVSIQQQQEQQQQPLQMIVSLTNHAQDQSEDEDPSSDESEVEDHSDHSSQEDAAEAQTEPLRENPPDNRTYPCDHCDRSFKTRFSRYHHYRKRECPRPVERKRPPYICDACNKTLTTRRGYLLHMKNMNCVNSKIELECPQCLKTFKTKVGLRTHRLLHLADDERPFRCEICKRGFATKLSFEIHQLVHAKHSCAVCEESFEGKKELRKHVLAHVEEMGKDVENCDCSDGRSLVEGKVERDSDDEDLSRD